MSSVTPEIQQMIDQKVQQAVERAMAEFELSMLTKVKLQVERSVRDQAVEKQKEKNSGDLADARRAIISHNRLVADEGALKKVPFKVVDEDMTPIYSLPPLISKDTIYQLSEDQVICYRRGYDIEPSEEGLEMDKLAINEAIGAVAASNPEDSSVPPSASVSRQPSRRHSPKPRTPA